MNNIDKIDIINEVGQSMDKYKIRKFTGQIIIEINVKDGGLVDFKVNELRRISEIKTAN